MNWTQTTFSPLSAGRGFLFDERNKKAVMMYKTMNDLAPEYLQSLFSQCHSAYNLRKADPVQTKHQLFETKLLLQRGHVME